MLEEEIQAFRDSDTKEYILKNNEQFLKIYINSSRILEISEMEYIMNNIINFFEFKYPDAMFYSHNNKSSFEYKKMKSIAELMTIDQLLFRIGEGSFNSFLNCDYYRNVHIKVMKNKYGFPHKTEYTVYMSASGIIDKYYIEQLIEIEEMEDLNINLSGVETIEDLYNKLQKLQNHEKIDCSEIELMKEKLKNDKILREMFLNLTALKMLYSENSLPIYSYPRVKAFIRTFNQQYGLNLNVYDIEKNIKIKIR